MGNHQLSDLGFGDVRNTQRICTAQFCLSDPDSSRLLSVLQALINGQTLTGERLGQLLMLGYSESNKSPVLARLLARTDELVAKASRVISRQDPRL